MKGTLNLAEMGRVPLEGDNAAIAIRRLEGGTRFFFRGRAHTLSHTLLEGHRFAIEPIAEGEAVLSWGLPFGRAVRPISPGDYLCNAKILTALEQRAIDFTLPERPNFEDRLQPYELDEARFQPGRQVGRYGEDRYFEGFERGGSRGVGTRNFIVILATTSRTAGYARALEARMKGAADRYPNIDGIVSVTHTEGGGEERPNNLDFLLSVLCGFMAHPNVGAVLAVDYGTEELTNSMLEAHLVEKGYPIAEVLHRFHSLTRDFASALAEGEAVVRSWLEPVSRFSRSRQPVSRLKLALQCGGSDAFSGVAGNPLAGWVAQELIRYGGSANLAETDELIGGEEYILSNTRDLETARLFLDKIAVFRERASWHGHTAEGNPSGGNNFRGLYNIAIKSIGAARKKAPEVCLDYVIDYGQRMSAPGFYFMDSPGNDLESIAGQVASGSNMIFFVTGNGSVTNFPFVPTVKFTTTTGRFDLLSGDMDINAGRYQDGTAMDELGRETFRYFVEVASGRPSVGEKAGHSQVSIWRNWKQQDAGNLARFQRSAEPAGEPIPIGKLPGAGRFRAIRTAQGFAADQVGLVQPTSLCSGQIARKIADHLNEKNFAAGRDVSRIVSLVHTEGCGSSGGENERHLTRTMQGYLLHPFVKKALLLEHGCEKIHNDAMRHYLAAQGVDIDRFGWASVQLDGGIEKVMAIAEAWFSAQLPPREVSPRQEVGLDALSLGLTCVGDLAHPIARALARLAATVVGGGGTVVVPDNASLLGLASFQEELAAEAPLNPTLDYGQRFTRPGFHIMAAPTDHAVETLSGLGATGVQAMLAHVAGQPLQAHPMIPLAQVSADRLTVGRFRDDLDRVLEPAETDAGKLFDELFPLVLRVVSQEYTPRLVKAGNIDFQMTRGWLGLSM